MKLLPYQGLVIIFIGSVLAGGLGYWAGKGAAVKKNVPLVPSVEPIPVCDTDAQRCPDGSFVGRSGPNCEFISCPTDPKKLTIATHIRQTDEMGELIPDQPLMNLVLMLPPDAEIIEDWPDDKTGVPDKIVINDSFFSLQVGSWLPEICDYQMSPSDCLFTNQTLTNGSILTLGKGKIGIFGLYVQAARIQNYTPPTLIIHKSSGDQLFTDNEIETWKKSYPRVKYRINSRV